METEAGRIHCCGDFHGECPRTRGSIITTAPGQQGAGEPLFKIDHPSETSVPCASPQLLRGYRKIGMINLFLEPRRWGLEKKPLKGETLRKGRRETKSCGIRARYCMRITA